MLHAEKRYPGMREYLSTGESSDEILSITSFLSGGGVCLLGEWFAPDCLVPGHDVFPEVKGVVPVVGEEVGMRQRRTVDAECSNGHEDGGGERVLEAPRRKKGEDRRKAEEGGELRGGLVRRRAVRRGGKDADCGGTQA